MAGAAVSFGTEELKKIEEFTNKTVSQIAKLKEIDLMAEQIADQLIREEKQGLKRFL